jgi:hypothetical protein
LVFLVHDGPDHLPQLVHAGFAPLHGKVICQGGFILYGPLPDGAGQQRHVLPDPAFEGVDPRLLAGIVGRELLQPAHLVENGILGQKVGLQVHAVTGNDVAPLAGLGVLE